MITTHWRRAILYVMMTSAILILKSPFCEPRKLLLSLARQKSTTPSPQSKSTFIPTGKTIEFAEQVIGEYFPHSSHPTPEDVQVIEKRQIGRPPHSIFAVEKSRCKYGFPQAFVQYPVSTAISSGMIRLACPHLVKGIDALEAEGGLDLFDTKLANENEDGVLRTTFDKANKAWRTIRDVTVNAEDRKHMDSKLGKEGADFLMDSGLIGCTIGKLQVKCLHAHVADHLMRGSNEIGAEALKMLEDKGVDVKGCDECWQQCDLKFTPTKSSWWYTSIKNKSRMTATRIAKSGNRVMEATTPVTEEKNENLT